MTMKDGSVCHKGHVKNIGIDHVFDREVALCQKLSKDGNGACSWGACKECGVIPLLYKLHKGILVEGEKEVKDLKKNILRLS